MQPFTDKDSLYCTFWTSDTTQLHSQRQISKHFHHLTSQPFSLPYHLGLVFSTHSQVFPHLSWKKLCCPACQELLKYKLPPLWEHTLCFSNHSILSVLIPLIPAISPVAQFQPHTTRGKLLPPASMEENLPKHFRHTLVPDFLLPFSLTLYSELPLLHTNHSTTFTVPGPGSAAHRSGLEPPHCAPAVSAASWLLPRLHFPQQPLPGTNLMLKH